MTDSSTCAATLIGQLMAQGVTDVVLAPGSRSAPLALSVAAAAQAGTLRLQVRVDERAAGFLALGLAKASRRPVAVITTSGTAVANLAPAVAEADHSGVPLVVVSADRPGELVGFGANQTMEQTGLFTDFLRYQARISHRAPLAATAAQTARAVLAATGVRTRRPGPVQLNVELGEPLVSGPVPAPTPGRRVNATGWSPVEPTRLPGTPRTLVLCGDAPVEVGAAARELAEDAQLPLYAEPSSNARGGPNALATGRLLLASDLASRIERVLVFGRPNLSRPVGRLLARDDVEIVAVGTSPDFPDPGWQVAQVVDAVSVETGEAQWLAAWQDADRARAAELAGLPGVGITGPQLAARVVASVGADQVLCLGNSNPIRDADLAPIRAEPVVTFANRGLSGIDGNLSTAVGIALATRRGTTLLCGDLTFVHDLGGLVVGEGEERPDLRIVVADDQGGSIFATLEYGHPDYAESFERVFATPTGVDLAAAVTGLGIPAVRVGTVAALDAALTAPIRGLSVVVVDVDRAHRGAFTQRLNR